MRKSFPALFLAAIGALMHSTTPNVVIAQQSAKSLSMLWTVSMVAGTPDQDTAPPAVIKSFTSPLKAIQFDAGTPASFVAEWNWLQGGKFLLTNTSDKTLNSVSVQLDYYVGDSRTPKRILEVKRGINTGFPGATADTWIKPGETFEVDIPDQGNFPLLLNAIADSRSEPGRIRISLSHVCFDGMPDRVWRHGSLMYRDPTDPMSFRVRRRTSKD
jgi:hypothetical protein